MTHSFPTPRSSDRFGLHLRLDAEDLFAHQPILTEIRHAWYVARATARLFDPGLWRGPGDYQYSFLHPEWGRWGWFERSEEHTSELQSLMRSSYAVFCLNKKTSNIIYQITNT